MMKLFYLIIIVSLFVSCATDVHLIPEAKDVLIVKKNLPNQHCKKMGDVTGRGFVFDNYQDYYNQMKNQAARMGANFVRLRSQQYGTAYRCERRQ